MVNSKTIGRLKLSELLLQYSEDKLDETVLFMAVYCIP